MRPYETGLVVALAGTRFGDAGALAGDLPPGTRLRLLRDPRNEHDRNAIAVLLDGQTGSRALKLGMVPAKSGSVNWAAALAPLMDRGERFEATLQQHSGTSVVVRIIGAETTLDFARLELEYRN